MVIGLKLNLAALENHREGTKPPFGGFNIKMDVRYPPESQWLETDSFPLILFTADVTSPTHDQEKMFKGEAHHRFT